MLRIIGRRIAITIPTLIGVVLVAFCLVELTPGDPAAIAAGEDASPERIAVIREQLGLDEPFLQRFADYLGNALTGDLGNSIGSTVPVWDQITRALPVTFSLGVVSMVMAVVLGVAIGTWAGIRRGRLVDHLVTATSSTALAIPSFVLGLALVVPLAINRSWLPAVGYTPVTESFIEWLEHLLLPGFALAIPSAAEMARQTRGALVDTLEEDYIRAVRAKGMPARVVLAKHAARNASTPVVTVAGLQVVRILGGAIVIERIFALDGFGSLAVGAVLSRDLVTIQGVVLVSAAFVLLTNLAVDLSYVFLSPRARAS